MRHPSEFAIDQEDQALDKIHAVLAEAPRSGLKAREIAHQAGLSIGRVQEVLRRSECVIRRIRGSMRWIADWTETPIEYRPASRRAKVAGQSHKLDHPVSTTGAATNPRCDPSPSKVISPASKQPFERFRRQGTDRAISP